MGGKQEQDPDGIANKRNAIPGQGDDVEGHVANKRTVTEGPEGVANKRNAIPGQEEDDVEGHVYSSRRPGDGELTSRKLPGDSPHGES